MAVDKTELLARRLNIVERLVVPNRRDEGCNGVRNSEKDFGTPRHLISLKFQTTSKKEMNKSKTGIREEENNEEIIEFAAAVASLETESIVAAFHQYVMPTEDRILSSYCRESTNISQEAVDNGVPLKTCLMLYSNWLAKLEKDIGLTLPSKQEKKKFPVTIPVTWSDWDLGECLPNEATRKRLVCLKHLNSSWTDLRHLWIERFNDVPTSLRDAVTRSKLIWKEKESRGLEYATNIASLALAMHEKGIRLKYTSKI